ncbi:MAG: tryptophan--tRNA ligase [Bacillota bacterium]|nr:tryptophan--tRNA ligase [Bacillota bacterium]
MSENKEADLTAANTENKAAKKKRVFSGVQPTGRLVLGNYLGAVKNWVPMQDENECCFCVVDQHSITVRQDPKELRQRCLDFLTLYIACGLDPDKSLIYFQSHVPAHAQLAWVLNCYTYMGELSRMTQFKEKSLKHQDNINAGLFTYPVLMAADILLYQTDLVPVGIDQKQHLEIAQIIAKRFNGAYGDVFRIPEAIIPKVGAKIMSLQDPTSKMSKSDVNPKAYIAVLDEPDTIIKKMKSAVTDSDGKVEYGDGKDGINNLLTIYSVATGESIESTQARFANLGYGDFKMQVAEAVVELLRPVREKYYDLKKNEDYVKSVYTKSADVANKIAGRTMDKVYKKIGFIAR